MLSAARNYYSGILLLAKECLIRAAPAADAKQILGEKFTPKPDGYGGVYYEVVVEKTIDFQQLEKRFKDFNLPWPEASLKQLQKLRNSIEHDHLKAPVNALSEAIASSFPVLLDFCKILDEDPQLIFADVWDTILEQRDVFEKVQKRCLASLEVIEWPAEVSRLDRMACPACGSCLIGQYDTANTDHQHVIGRCFQCGEEIHFERFIEIIVTAAYAIDPCILAKEGQSSPIASCPECGASAYVEHEDVSICFVCGVSIAGEYARCGATIDVNEYSPDYPSLCSYCAHMADKLCASNPTHIRN